MPERSSISLTNGQSKKAENHAAAADCLPAPRESGRVRPASLSNAGEKTSLIWGRIPSNHKRFQICGLHVMHGQSASLPSELMCLKTWCRSLATASLGCLFSAAMAAAIFAVT